MAPTYQVRLRAAALEELKASRQRLRGQLGSSRVGERLTDLDPQAAGELANALLSLLDAVEGVIERAKPIA